MLRWGKYVFLTPERLDRAEAFFNRHGAKIIVIARFIEGNKAADETKLTDDARMGAYWGIDTDPGKVNPDKALPCDPKLTHQLARVSTRLSDLGDTISKQIVNWGYVVSDRSLRANYTGPMNAIDDAPPRLPYPDAPLA